MLDTEDVIIIQKMINEAIRQERESRECMGGDCLTEGPHDSSRCSV